MKKFALIATVAALAIPAGAQAAKDTMKSNWYDGATTVNFTVQEGEIYNGAPFIPEKNETITLDLVRGGKLMLKGEAAYLINENGSKYLANNAPHMTTAGITYQTEDGVVLYATPSAKTYTFKADVRDQDNDGYADDVDVTIN